MNERFALRAVIVVFFVAVVLQVCTSRARAVTRAEVEASRARVEAVHAAIDLATDNPEWRVELRRVCQRESWCNKFAVMGVHAGDAKLGAVRWQRARDRRLVDPDSCEHHTLGDDPSQWSTRGAFGTSAAYVVRFLDECAPPSALDDPQHAARAAVGWMNKLCTRYDACTCRDRVRWWMGPGVWRVRSNVDRLVSEQRQCGPQPWWRWAWAGVLDGVRLYRELESLLPEPFDEESKKHT